VTICGFETMYCSFEVSHQNTITLPGQQGSRTVNMNIIAGE